MNTGRYEAIFLERDGTLSRISPGRVEALNAAIGELLGRDVTMGWADYEVRFPRALEACEARRIDSLEREPAFWRKLYELTLADLGLDGDPAGAAARLYEAFPFHALMEPYPEAREVVEELAGRGYRLGVIGDTFPSLELSIRAMGLAEHFDSFTASAVVGVGKPDPRIFQAALDSLDAVPERSLFVDDALDEVEGARRCGLTAFHLDRTRAEPDLERRVLADLTDLIAFLDAAG